MNKANICKISRQDTRQKAHLLLRILFREKNFRILFGLFYFYKNVFI